MAQLSTADLLTLINAGGTGQAAPGAGDYIGPLATGLYDLYRGISGGSAGDLGRAKEAAAAADPFSTQRPAYQKQLMDLLTKPGSFQTDPGYQFALGQGQDAIKGAGNAIYGGTRAGAIYPELAKFTEGYANQAYDTRVNQLSGLAGMNAGSPGTAGALLAGGFQNQNQDIGSGLSSALLGLLGGRALGTAGDGIIGLLGKYLTPNSTGSLPSGSYPNFAGGSNSTPFNSLVGGGGDPYSSFAGGTGQTPFNSLAPGDLGGDDWFNNMFGNNGAGGGFDENWFNDIFGG